MIRQVYRIGLIVSLLTGTVVGAAERIRDEELLTLYGGWNLKWDLDCEETPNAPSCPSDGFVWISTQGLAWCTAFHKKKAEILLPITAGRIMTRIHSLQTAPGYIMDSTWRVTAYRKRAILIRILDSQIFPSIKSVLIHDFKREVP